MVLFLHSIANAFGPSMTAQVAINARSWEQEFFVVILKMETNSSESAENKSPETKQTDNEPQLVSANIHYEEHPPFGRFRPGSIRLVNPSHSRRSRYAPPHKVFRKEAEPRSAVLRVDLAIAA